MIQIGKIISRRKYQFLKGFSENALSDEEIKKIEEYEKANVKSIPKDYFKNLETKKEPITHISTNWLKTEFKKTFEIQEKKQMILTEELKSIYNALCLYFSKNKEFENTNLTINNPSLDKGLLFIGGFGCGKTSSLKAFHEIGRKIYEQTGDLFMWFRLISCNGLVAEYEGLETSKDKKDFMQKYTTGIVYFDDFGTESDASNYGKKNLMKDILEERYLKETKCHLTTNLSLDEIAERYGGRVFDRMQEMFNIIVWEGESFRK